MVQTATERALEAAVQRRATLPGRRERKKQRTRDALIDAAFDLFERNGFGGTTVEEIADTVDVSARTFFRYFSSKEDVALTFQEEQFQAAIDELAVIPADVPVVTALRRAVTAVAVACETGERGLRTDRFTCMQTMMEASDALLARSLEHGQKKQALLTEQVAERMGVDPCTDLRPHVVASAAMCVLRATADAWRAGATRHETFSEAVQEAFGYVEEGLNYPAVGST